MHLCKLYWELWLGELTPGLRWPRNCNLQARNNNVHSQSMHRRSHKQVYAQGPKAKRKEDPHNTLESGHMLA